MAPGPNGSDYDPTYAHNLSMLAIETGLWIKYEIIENEWILNVPSRAIAKGIRKRKPVEDYLLSQGRFAHFLPEDIKKFQDKIDETWEKWWIPGLVTITPG